MTRLASRGKHLPLKRDADAVWTNLGGRNCTGQIKTLELSSALSNANELA